MVSPLGSTFLKGSHTANILSADTNQTRMAHCFEPLLINLTARLGPSNRDKAPITLVHEHCHHLNFVGVLYFSCYRFS